MKEKTKQEIEKLTDYFKGKGWSCRNEVPTIFKKNDKNGIKGLSINRIDTCCEDLSSKTIQCFEFEDGNQFQAVKNARAANEFLNDMKSRGVYDNVNFCQLHPEENFLEVCNNNNINNPVSKEIMGTPTKPVKSNKLLLPKRINLSW